jgi:RNA polymerase sigma factor (sigma-70 family)
MRAAVAWRDLLPRLEDDLRRARQEGDAIRDDVAWEMARRRVQDIVNAVARRFSVSENSEDLVQDLMLSLQSSDMLRRMRLAGSPEGYLYVVIRNRTLDAARRRGRDLRLQSPLVDEPSTDDVHEGDSEQTGAALRHAIRDLSVEERQLLRLRFGRGWSIAAIAEHRGEPYSRVAVRIFRLLRRLRVKLQASQR